MNLSTPQLLPTSSPIFTPPPLSTNSGAFFCLKSKRRRRRWPKFALTSQNSNSTTAPSQHSSQDDVVVPNSNSGNEHFEFSLSNPLIPASVSKLSSTDQAFLLLAFIGSTTCVAFTAFVAVAAPTLFAMQRAALSFAKLADTACEELPSTMAAVRLSGMEISDLTLELSDLSQEITDGVNKSAQVVQAAEAGVRQIGSVAHQKTMNMIQERANLPIISLQPAVAGAAKKTSLAVGQAAKNFLKVISRGDSDSDGISNDRIDE